MSAPATKRPLEAGRSSPSAARTSRSSTPSGERSTGAGPATPTTPSGVARTRSIRSSTLVSGRAGAAAARRHESRLSNATSADTVAAQEAQEAARAETVALLDDLRARLSQAEGQAEQFRRLSEVQRTQLDETHREQMRLEEKTHEYDEQLEALANEKREMARQMQQMESIYEAERSAMTREKEDMANREEEMQTVIQRLKDSLAQRDEEGRPSRQTSNSSPSLEGGSFAPPSSLNRSDSRNNSKLLLQKDKLIESLRLELAEAQIKLVESENQGGGRLHEVERQLMEARMANARLMEDNESYQLLLQEKTLKGDFGTADFGYAGLATPAAGTATPSRSRSSNRDALNALEGVSASSLADELSGVGETDSETDSVADGHEHAHALTEAQRRHEAELKSLQDQNKALTLYINKIIERLLEHQDYQYILDKSGDGKQPQPQPRPTLPGAGASAILTNKELPPAPPSATGLAGAAVLTGAGASVPWTPEQAGFQTFLQRTKSMAVGGSNAARVRPVRPASVMHESALNNPDTAPSIPISLTRGTSVRRVRPMSEQYTAPSAASVVNAMYKGPDGPLSPSFRNSGHFFGGAAAAAGGNNSGPRSPRSPGLPSSGNFPGMRSETSSVSGDGLGGSSSSSDSVTTPTSSGHSPPRQHEKTAFTGSKPRPLRLVQENTDRTETVNKRASWIGWAFGGKKDDSPVTVLAGSDAIQE